MGKLLVIADTQNRCAATPRGLELARRLDQATEVVGFVWAPLKALELSPAEQAELKQRLLNSRERELEERIARFAASDQKVTLKVVWEKDIVPWVNRRVERGNYQAVIKTGRRTESATHTPTDWQLLRECPAPVLIVAREKWHRTKPVLAALDLGSRNKRKLQLNRQIIERASTIADALKAELKLVCAVEVPSLLSELDMVDPIAFTKEQKKRMAPRIAELAKTYDVPRSAFVVKRGPVGKVITSEAARIRAQLVVMGTVGRKGVKARLLGNTVESVLNLLHTDVLALKP